MDRRRFVGVAVGASLAPLLGACASMMTHRVVPRDGAVRVDLAAFPDLVAPGGALRLQPEGYADPVYVLALDDGSFAAVSPICTHRGCTVDVSGPSLVCPCHGSTYDRTGVVLEGPAERPLHRFPARRLDDGVLHILLQS